MQESSAIEEATNPNGGYGPVVTAPTVPQFATVSSSPVTTFSRDEYGSKTSNTYAAIGTHDYSEYPGNTHDSYSVGKFGTSTASPTIFTEQMIQSTSPPAHISHEFNTPRKSLMFLKHRSNSYKRPKISWD
ncbi:hypothetical protein Y032_0156g3148 [Ancylostoma ceylanicum]|uniref:Uncharacterized protein n=1 Tax=Ancylostoma ceylanicum TaxID=53326 RepID=A0A016SZ88_9BILA|nr:hypothetical protein Y032_0156g3148 [Ancylostoma ceylanicum]